VTVIRTYRSNGGDLEARIKAALSAFWAEFKQKPQAIILPISEAEVGRELLEKLSPGSGIKARKNGGVLIGEVWLQVPVQVPEGEQKP
jgi:hypothetical protein